jgi:hypothetical protein
LGPGMLLFLGGYVYACDMNVSCFEVT